MSTELKNLKDFIKKHSKKHRQSGECLIILNNVDFLAGLNELVDKLDEEDE